MLYEVITRTGEYEARCVNRRFICQRKQGESMITKSLRKTLLANSILAVTLVVAGSVMPATAIAQSADDEPIEEVVVKGFRSSLRQAVALKRDRNNFV